MVKLPNRGGWFPIVLPVDRVIDKALVTARPVSDRRLRGLVGNERASKEELKKVAQATSPQLPSVEARMMPLGESLTLVQAPMSVKDVTAASWALAMTRIKQRVGAKW